MVQMKVLKRDSFLPLKTLRIYPFSLLAASLLAGATFAGCGLFEEEAVSVEQDDGVEELSIVVEADSSRIEEAEKNLQAKKNSIATDRDRLKKERDEITQKLASLSQKDKSQRDKLEATEKRIADEEDRLRKRAADIDKERRDLELEKTRLIQENARLVEQLKRMNQNKGGMSVEQREEIIIRREDSVARRESKVVDQEKEVQKLHKESLRTLEAIQAILVNLQNSAKMMPAAAPIIMPAPAAAPGAPRASKSQVQRSFKQLRSSMDVKGVLAADLSPQAQEIYKAAQRSMNSNDWDTSEELMAQAKAHIDAIRINQPFVSAKFERMNREYQAKSKKLSEDNQQKVVKLLAQVSDAFSDGRYDRANKRINQIFGYLND